MGYTHYWTKHRNFTADEWCQITASAKIICGRYDNIVRRKRVGNQKPRIDDEVILFNGIGDDGHETFAITRTCDHPGDWRFCKTARKPYDDPVVEILNVARAYAPEAITLDTDGKMTGENINPLETT